MNIEEALRNIEESSNLNITKRSFDADEKAWESYSEAAKKTNMSKFYINTVMLQLFTQELNKILDKNNKR